MGFNEFMQLYSCWFRHKKNRKPLDEIPGSYWKCYCRCLRTVIDSSGSHRISVHNITSLRGVRGRVAIVSPRNVELNKTEWAPRKIQRLQRTWAHPRASCQLFDLSQVRSPPFKGKIREGMAIRKYDTAFVRKSRKKSAGGEGGIDYMQKVIP